MGYVGAVESKGWNIMKGERMSEKSDKMNRRNFLRSSLAASAGGSLAMGAGSAAGKDDSENPGHKTAPDPEEVGMPCGNIGNLKVSRLLLGGNLLTHFTHSRDLRYVYDLTAHYNTREKIMETMALAEQHGVNTLVVHNPPDIIRTLKKYRSEHGGQIQWIICPTAECKPGMKEYAQQVEKLVEGGADAIYVWGVRGDQLFRDGKMELVKEAVAIAKGAGVPSGVGAHDLRVIEACEELGAGAEFYIKTFHHHKYPTAPKKEEINGPHSEIPGYWCKDPQRTVKVMEQVDKPWIAFKVMAAGAIPPQNAFPYVVNNGADHVLAGMFDFEIAEDVKVARHAFKNANRKRPLCS